MTPAQKRLAKMYAAIGASPETVAKALGVPQTRGQNYKLLLKETRAVRHKSAKRKAKTKVSSDQKSVRMRKPRVSTYEARAPRVAGTTGFYLPPRAPETPVEPYFAVPATPPVRVVVLKAAPIPVDCPPQSSSASSTTLRPLAGESSPREFKGSCKARCALTGLVCRLPAHDGQHRNERGAFVLVATPGQTHFPRKVEVEVAALAGRRESDPDVDSGRHAIVKRAREKWREKHRASPARSAHLGHATTTGGGEKAEHLRGAG